MDSAINDKARVSIIGVSRAKEATYNQYQTLGVAVETDKEATVPNPTFTVENNQGRASGKELPDKITLAYVNSINFPFQFGYLQPHELLMLAAFAFGERAAPVSLGQGCYRHKAWTKSGIDRSANAIAYPISNPGPENPSFTTGFQLSASNPIAKLLAAGCKMNTFVLEANKADRFATANGDVIASGKQKTNIRDEVVTGLSGATSVTLGRKVYGTTAQTRLDSLHGMFADVDGDGRYEERVNVSAISSANPAVATISPVSHLVSKLVYSDNGVLTDYTDEANNATANDVPAALVTDEDYLLVGFNDRVAELFVDVGAVANATAAALTIEYWNGAAWVAVTGLADGTLNTGATFGQDGMIRFQQPGSAWLRSYLGPDGEKASLFWLRFSVDASLDAGTVITKIEGSTNSAGGISDLPFDKVFKFVSPTYNDETADASDYVGGTVSVGLQTADFLYLGSSRPFGGARFDIATVNAIVSVISVEYWDGAAWSALTPIVDGTKPAGTSFAVDGDITWAAPADWTKTAVGGETTTRYWVRLKAGANMTAGATANSVRLISKSVKFSVVYRQDETLYLPEMETMPGVINTESALILAKSRVVKGGVFDGVSIQDGDKLGCELNGFTVNWNNNHGDPVPCWQGESDGAYADEIRRGDPEGTVTVDRRMIDWLNQAGIRNGDIFSIHIELLGKPIDDTNPEILFSATIHMDQCWYEENQIGSNESRYTEALTIRIGESDTHPAIVVNVVNQDPLGFGYAA